jgi:hypothetical protein
MILPPDVGGLELKLIGGMGIKPGTQSGMNDFLLYATSSYGNKNTNSSTRKRYDCIQTLFNADDESNTTGLYENDPTKPFSQVSTVQDLTLPYFLLMSVTYTPYVSYIISLCF